MYAGGNDLGEYLPNFDDVRERSSVPGRLEGMGPIQNWVSAGVAQFIFGNRPCRQRRRRCRRWLNVVGVCGSSLQIASVFSEK